MDTAHIEPSFESMKWATKYFEFFIMWDIRPANYQGEVDPRSPKEKQKYIEALAKMYSLWGGNEDE